MKAIILAAGKGERLWPLTKYKPKPLIGLGRGNTILRIQLDVLKKFNEIKEAVIVTGYKAEMIDNAIVEWGFEDFARTIYNPFYEVSNNLVSLWLALLAEAPTEGLLITNGDNLFADTIISKVISKETNGIYLVVDKKRKYDNDDMKVWIQNGAIKYVSKEIPREYISAESTGIALIRGFKQTMLFRDTASLLLKSDKSYLNRFWLEVFNRLAEEGIPILPVFVKPNEWAEMDIHSDKEVISMLLSKKPWGYY